LLEKISIGDNFAGPVKVEALKILSEFLKLFPLEVSLDESFLQQLGAQLIPQINQVLTIQDYLNDN
jgi:hypothetical protein